MRHNDCRASFFARMKAAYQREVLVMSLQSAICPLRAIAAEQPCLRPSFRRKIISIGRAIVIIVATVTLPYSFGGTGRIVSTAWAENADDNSSGIPDDVHANGG